MNRGGEDMGKWPVAVVERHPDGSKSKHYFESADAANLAIQELAKPDRSYEIVSTAWPHLLLKPAQPSGEE